MSQENVEIVCELPEAFQHRQPERAFDFYYPKSNGTPRPSQSPARPPADTKSIGYLQTE